MTSVDGQQEPDPMRTHSPFTLQSVPGVVCTTRGVRLPKPVREWSEQLGKTSPPGCQ